MSSKKPTPTPIKSSPVAKYGSVNERPVHASLPPTVGPAMTPGDMMRQNFRENTKAMEETLSAPMNTSVTSDLMCELEAEIVATRASIHLLADALRPFRNNTGVECSEPKGEAPQPCSSPLNQRLRDNIKALREMQAFLSDVAVEVVS